jgi:hypothetical protein
MKTKTPIGLTLLVAAALNAAPPTADGVLSAARKALGGADQLAALKGLTASGTYQRVPVFTPVLSGPDGTSRQGPPRITGSREVSVMLPNNYVKYDAATNGPGITTIEGLGDGTGWNDVRMPPGVQGTVLQVPPGPPLDKERRQILARYLVAWRLDAPGAQFTYAGEAQSPEGKADILDVKGPDDFSARLYIDQTTHFPLMMAFAGKAITGPPPIGANGVPDPSRIPMKDVEIQMHFSNYEKTNGLLMPKTIIWSADGQTSEQFEITRYTLNPAFKTARFHK